MTAPLQHDYTVTPAEVFLRSWLLPIAATAGAVGSKLWATGLPKPYRAVRRISGPLRLDSDEPLMRVHTFGATYSEASIEAAKTDSRMLVLADYPGWTTTLANATKVYCDWVDVTEAAHEEDYGAESAVTRFVTEVRLGLTLVAV